MKVIATNGEESVPVKIYHWWPGREWAGPSPIEAIENRLGGSRYITVARTRLLVDWPIWDDPKDGTWPMPEDGWTVQGIARCCHKDVPDRKRGREIALGRLAKQLERVNWRLEVT